MEVVHFKQYVEPQKETHDEWGVQSFAQTLKELMGVFAITTKWIGVQEEQE